MWDLNCDLNDEFNSLFLKLNIFFFQQNSYLDQTKYNLEKRIHLLHILQNKKIRISTFSVAIVTNLVKLIN